MLIPASTLRQKLIEARYKMLVAARPIAPAKVAYNLMLQALVDTVRAGGEDSTAIEAIQKELEMNDL